MHFSTARMAVAVLAALILSPASARASDNLAGQASVIDGDTLEIHGTHPTVGHRRAGKQSAMSRRE
jgi:endonuclease YncB( thermonuclease family)